MITMQYLLTMMLLSVNHVIGEALTWRFACLSDITFCRLHVAFHFDTDYLNKSANMSGLDFMATLRVSFGTPFTL